MTTVQTVGLIVSLTALVLSSLAAVAALVQARVAVGARDDAIAAQSEARAARDETVALARAANVELRRLADADERANELREAESARTWVPQQQGANLIRVVNATLRVMIVDSFDVLPDVAARKVHVQHAADDGRYEPGDSFDLMLSRTMGPQPRKFTARWHYEDDPTGEVNSYILPL